VLLCFQLHIFVYHRDRAIWQKMLIVYASRTNKMAISLLLLFSLSY
jgi:hypothetical protein